jgi:hypothetical protein
VDWGWGLVEIGLEGGGVGALNYAKSGVGGGGECCF